MTLLPYPKFSSLSGTSQLVKSSRRARIKNYGDTGVTVPHPLALRPQSRGQMALINWDLALKGWKKKL